MPRRDELEARPRRLLIALFLGAFVLALAVYFLALRPWMLNWGASATESSMTLPGDELVPRYDYQNTRALTVNAPAESVWPWLVQVGQGRAGFYSYSWLENLTFADIHNADHVDPSWQDLRVGDFIRLTAKDWPLGLVRRKTPVIGCPVHALEPGTTLVLRGWGSFILRPMTAEATRLVVRGRTGPFPALLRPLWQTFFDPLHFIMEREMMEGLKRRAEGFPPTSGVWQSLASVGFILAALGSVLYLLSRRKKWLRLGLPCFYGLLILVSTRDAQAALVGLAATLLLMAGVTFFRKWWWAYLGVMFLYAHLVLFLAGDAYLAFGLIFLAVFTVGAVILLAKREFARKSP